MHADRRRRTGLAERRTRDPGGSLRAQSSDAEHVAQVRGVTDMTSCDQVRVFLRQCRRAIATDCDGLSLDLSEVKIADSKLVACLVLVRQAAHRDHVKVSLNASEIVRDLIGLYRLDPVLSASMSELT